MLSSTSENLLEQSSGLPSILRSLMELTISASRSYVKRVFTFGYKHLLLLLQLLLVLCFAKVVQWNCRT